MSKSNKNIKHLGLLRAILNDECPNKVSKSFAEDTFKQIEKIHSNQSIFARNVVNYASTFVFAVLTLFVLSYSGEQIKYSKSNIDGKNAPITENVKFNDSNCEEDKPHKNKDSVCK